MSQNYYKWEKEAFLGSTILHSNSDKNRYDVVFAGAEKLGNTLQYKVHFIYNFHSIGNSPNCHCMFPSSSNMTVMATYGQSIRLARHLGINEEVTITYRPEDHGSCLRFFPVKQLKFLEIKTDYIRYEFHSI
ncbi:hypothetical protein CACET_c11110 [Clostridium aceticum]|uniref:Uncharacterized protein n=1 Tax=Clostridium aceticum TaxID=84022 RepID=A0A0D8I8A3_9CLOT|nr:hypothetical protein [Clostridium aceticum]AKL94576.1 hypothetical protein CACET_c11110 [Clostridium aceticum]KJF26510.1 hypothetical protein TZ02_13395 [Clostridium aceticum]